MKPTLRQDSFHLNRKWLARPRWILLGALLALASTAGAATINVTTNFLRLEGGWIDTVGGEPFTFGSFGAAGTNSPGIFASGGSPSGNLTAGGSIDSFNLDIHASAIASGPWTYFPPNSYINALGITQFTTDGTGGPYLEVILEGWLGYPSRGLFRFTLMDLTTPGPYLVNWEGPPSAYPGIGSVYTVPADPSHEYAFILEGAAGAEAGLSDYKQVVAHVSITNIPECHTASLLALYLCGLAASRKIRNTASRWPGF